MSLGLIIVFVLLLIMFTGSVIYTGMIIAVIWFALRVLGGDSYDVH